MTERKAKKPEQGARLELAGGNGVLIRDLAATREVRRVKPTRLKKLVAGPIAVEVGSPE